MDLRDQFAMAAPAAPEGFVVDYETKLQKPKCPTLPKDISDEERKYLKDWVEDPCWDLEPKFSEFEKAMKAYWNDKVDFQDAVSNERLAKKQAAWAYKYADAMIAEREKGSVDSVYSTKQELIKAIKEQHGLDVSNLHFLTAGHLIFILRTGRITAG